MRFPIIYNSHCIFAAVTLLLCLHEENALLVPFNKWVSTAANNVKKTVSIATAVVCLFGMPSISIAEEPSLQSQLKVLQDVKVASQKLAIELAEQDLQTKELLYPEGRLVGRGIIRLIPESGTFEWLGPISCQLNSYLLRIDDAASPRWICSCYHCAHISDIISVNSVV